MYSKSTRAFLLFATLAFGVVACDSGGGMDSEPEPEPEPDDIEATVQGTLTNASTDDPIEGAEVTVIRIDGLNEQVGDTTTGTDGSYEVSFTVSEDDAPDQLRVEGDADGFLAADDTVDFSESVTSDLALEEAVQSEVSGQITNDDTGEGINGATVTGTDQEENLVFETTTDASGQYSASLELAEAPDQIAVEAAAEDFEGAEETVQFAEEISLNFALLPKIIDVLIDGTVTSEDDGEGIGDATVEGSRPDEDALLADTTTTSDGFYELSFTVKAPQAPDDLRIEVSEAFAHEDQEKTVSFDSTLTEDFTLATAPIEISTLEELQKIGGEPRYPIDGDYVLVNDIDATETESMNGGQGFNPIGDDDIPFDGTFDGNGFVISNLVIDRSSETYVGLFGDVENGEVTNLTLSQVSITGNSIVGGIAGELGQFGGSTSGEVIDSEVSGTVQGSSTGISFDPSTTGGVVGSNESGGAIRGSSFEGTVVGTATTGGISGYNQGIIEESSSEGEVVPNDGTSGSKLGGVVGWNRFSGTIETSRTSSTVSGGEDTGGIVGENEGSLDKSYSTGDVSGRQKVGGVAGINDEGDISESYTAGDVSGNEDVGGVVGANAGTLSDTFWDTQTTGQDNGVGRGDFDGVTGLTTDEMQGDSAQENMDGFDFQDTWQVVTGDYPALSWEDL